MSPSLPLGGQDEIDDAHLLDMIDWSGPLPDNLFSAWPRAQYYFRSNGKLFNSIIGAKHQKETVPPSESMDSAFKRQKPTELDEEGDIGLSLLRRGFRYEPEKRPSTNDVLNHPWLKTKVS